MTPSSRRSVLRTGAALALATTIAGCSGAIGDRSSDEDGIPGVEDGEIVDHRAFANAHGDQLAARSGTLEWARTSLDPETGDPETHALWTVRVEDERVHAVVTGRASFSGTGGDRLEFYYGDDATFSRTRTDGEWESGSSEPNAAAVSRGEFTGRSTLETVATSKTGTETVDGEELHRFSKNGRGAEDEQVEWVSIQALADDAGLVHSFQQTLADTGRNTRRFDEWHVTDLDATSVERPDWVDEVDG